MKHTNTRKVDETFSSPPRQIGTVKGFAQTTDSLNETLILIYGRGRQRKISKKRGALGKIKDRALVNRQPRLNTKIQLGHQRQRENTPCIMHSPRCVPNCTICACHCYCFKQLELAFCVSFRMVVLFEMCKGNCVLVCRVEDKH